MIAKLGLSGKIYYLATGTRAAWGTVNSTTGLYEGPAPSGLTEIPNVISPSINLSKGQAEVSTRGNNGWKAYLAALKDGTLEWEMIYDNTDANMLALLTAWLKNTTIALAMLDDDKATVGTLGFWMDFQVFDFSKTEELEQGQKVKIQLKPTYSSVAPQVVKVTS